MGDWTVRGGESEGCKISWDQQGMTPEPGVKNPG